MAFGKKNHLVGLDVGSRTLKVGELVESKQGYSLKKFGMSDIPPGLIEDGVVKNPEDVADAIRQLFKMYKIKGQNVAISIGGYSIIVKTISVQAQAEDAREEVGQQLVAFKIVGGVPSVFKGGAP